MYRPDAASATVFNQINFLLLLPGFKPLHSQKKLLCSSYCSIGRHFKGIYWSFKSFRSDKKFAIFLKMQKNLLFSWKIWKRHFRVSEQMFENVWLIGTKCRNSCDLLSACLICIQCWSLGERGFMLETAQALLMASKPGMMTLRLIPTPEVGACRDSHASHQQQGFN